MPSPSLHDISFAMEYATKEAREASFAPPNKRSKGGWPHKTPTAAALSRAGFYFKPSPHSNDNTVCFLCDRNLDGWEADDDPVQEHLKHAEDCGWARLMSIEAIREHDTNNMEDPTEQRLVQARKLTFAVGWPHENKRGWTCKTDKMVEAGWYFAPTSGSEDYVSCAYCKLSLDGWEPKDNPFTEHYSRSPNCPFFVFAGSTAPSKRPKAKKGRASRSSRTSKVSTRLSTQSNITIQSETSSIPDLDESIDNSIVSIKSTASTATTKGKRKARTTQTKTSKAKRTKNSRSKASQRVDTDTEQTSLRETSEPSVAYPLLEQDVTQEPRDPELSTDASQDMPISLEVEPDAVVERETGPPEVPASTIPATVKSPVPSPKRKSVVSLPSARKRAGEGEKEERARAATPVLRSSPSQPSDIENAPPSTRPESVRPPLSSPGMIPPKWNAVDIDTIFEPVSEYDNNTMDISDTEKQMTVQDWIKHIAEKAEAELRAEGERVVGIFETEGHKALTVLESIVCV